MSKFRRKSKKGQQAINTASLPDIVFMLLFFFMVSTVLRETEIKVQTRLPSAEALTKIEQKRLISYVYIGPRKTGPNEQQGETAIQIDDALIETQSSIRQIMYSKLQEQPKLIVSLKVDRESPMRVVNEVQQELREANALRINYSSTRESGSQ